MKKNLVIKIEEKATAGDDMKHCLECRKLLNIPMRNMQLGFNFMNNNPLAVVNIMVKNPAFSERVVVTTFPLMHFVDEYDCLREKYNIYICGNDFVFPYFYTFLETEPSYKNDITFIGDSPSPIQSTIKYTKNTGKEISFEIINGEEFIKRIKNE